MAEPKERSWLDSPWTTAGAVGIPAILAFLLARRIRGGGPVPSRVSKAIREKGLLREVPAEDLSKSDLINYLQFGTPDVAATAMKAPARAQRVGMPVFSPHAGTPRHIRSTIPGGTIGTGKPMAGLGAKDVEAGIFRKAVPDLYPETIRGTQIPMRIRNIRDPLVRAEAIQKHLNKRFGQWIIKGTDEAQTAGTLLTEKSDLKAVMRQALKRGPGSRLALERTLFDKLKGTPRSITYGKLKKLPEEQQAILRQKLPHLLGEEHMKTLARWPGDMIVQKRMPIQQLGPLDRATNWLTTGAPGQRELRVHAVGNKVIPEATGHRFGGISELATTFGYRPDTFSKAEKAVRRALNKVQRQNPDYVKNRAFAFDVAITPRGQAKIIEANPEGFSGFLHPSGHLAGAFDPFAAVRSHRFVSALQGQKTMPLALAQAGAAGGLGYGSLAGARKIRDVLES